MEIDFLKAEQSSDSVFQKAEVASISVTSESHGGASEVSASLGEVSFPKLNADAEWTGDGAAGFALRGEADTGGINFAAAEIKDQACAKLFGTEICVGITAEAAAGTPSGSIKGELVGGVAESRIGLEAGMSNGPTTITFGAFLEVRDTRY